MNLPVLSTAAKTMSSREIAELVGTTHDSVLKTVRGLIARGVVSGNETPYTHPQNGQQYPEFLLNYRNTMIVASGYSPEMRARIIDRWIELERSAIPRTLPEALRLAADLAERVEQQQARLVVAEPKAAGYDRISQAQGELCIRDAAKTLAIPERAFIQWLIECRWLYRDQSQALRPYADRVRSGHLAERISTPRQTVQGEKVFAQTIITPAGMARLAAMAERRGKLTVVGGVA